VQVAAISVHYCLCAAQAAAWNSTWLDALLFFALSRVLGGFMLGLVTVRGPPPPLCAQRPPVRAAPAPAAAPGGLPGPFQFKC
jgi:hypothetical protein